MENIGSRIAYYLVEKGLIQKEDLESVLAANQPIGAPPIEEQLINAGFLTPEQFRSVAEEFFGTPFASQDDFPKEPILFRPPLDPIHERVKIYPLPLDG